VLKAFASLLGYDPGFDASRILAVNVTTSAARYQDRPAARAFLDPALAAIQNVPGVEAAGAITAMPYVSWGNNGGVRYEGRPKLDPTRLPIVENRGVSPDFFAATRQRLVSGRLLRSSDDAQSPPVVVVNQALVKRDFEGRDPVGTRYHLDDTTFATIVGVVSDIRNAGPVVPPAPEMYYTYAQGGSGNTNFPIMIRVRGRNPMQVAAAVRTAIRGVDETAAIGSMRPMREVIVGSLGRPQFYFSLLACFAAVAVLLTVAGLYGVLSYAVAQRTREIGIRTALGSSRVVLVRMVTGEGLRLVALGVVFGLAGGFVLTRLLTTMLYGVSPLDMTAWAAAVAVMVVVATLATLVPAFRASRVDPMEAMRAE
jgi:predicted permease